jgi:hypothetical protein
MVLTNTGADMASLKGFTDQFAEDLGTTPALIYERQRALTRAKVLRPIKKGKGPGHGVVASAETAAQVLIAVMASPDLASTVDRTLEVGNLKRNQSRFSDTITELLASADEAAKLASITFSKSLPYAVVTYRKGVSLKSSETYGDKGQFARALTRVLIEVDGSLILRMAKHLAGEK